MTREQFFKGIVDRGPKHVALFEAKRTLYLALLSLDPDDYTTSDLDIMERLARDPDIQQVLDLCR